MSVTRIKENDHAEMIEHRVHKVYFCALWESRGRNELKVSFHLLKVSFNNNYPQMTLITQIEA
ncbi:hypothetical protein SBDP1_430022 [Syntrophobacter sp. SbD1]|nr:hypothetical protein SBDP1_430022 [Syntrophobacter sp. SbD1]